MEKYSKRILSLFAVFAMVISLVVVPAHAEYESFTGTFWSRYIREVTGSVSDVPLLGSILSSITSSGSQSVCGKSDDQLHHADAYIDSGTANDGSPIVLCRCKYCGQEFGAYASDLDTAYKKYVQTLPASGYTSDGGLIWYPTFSNIKSFTMLALNYSGWKYLGPYTTADLPISDVSSDGVSYMVYSLQSNRTIRASMGIANSFRLSRFGFGKLNLVAPVSGSYCRLESPCFDYRYLTTSGQSFSGTKTFSRYSSYFHYASGSVFEMNGNEFLGGDVTCTSLSGLLYLPVYRIIPDTAIAPSPGEDYSAETRPGSLVGLYGDVNGSAFSDNEITLVDESGKTIYNPVTGETYNFTDWTYDYSTRTYTITTDNSQTVTVNYGDEYVTIKEGDTIYNVYYIVQGGGGTPVDPDTCQHTYTSATDREPTCTVPGSKTLTCSKCGNVTTESIPAKGHTWTILQTVQTSYDENGELVQQGYTIYQCSVCGEQYKDINGTGPPDSGGEDGKKSIWEKIGDLISSVADGFITIIETALGKILDYLIALVEAINAKLESVVNAIFGLFDRIPQLFGGFTDFLVAVFPFMPQEFFDILIFTLLVICAAAIIRFLWKR